MDEKACEKAGYSCWDLILTAAKTANYLSKLTLSLELKTKNNEKVIKWQK